MRPVEQRHHQWTTVEDPPLARALLEDVRWSWIWLIARVFVGWQWLSAGWLKLGSPAWMARGASLQSLWNQALNPVAGSPGWLGGLLTWLLASGSYVWAARTVALTETLMGIALILGVMTGAAAFAGSLVSFSLMLAGGGMMNPLLFGLAVALILAWKTAGWIGLDRWLLPVLAIAWHRGVRFHEGRSGNRRTISMIEAPREACAYAGVPAGTSEQPRRAR